MSDPCAPYYDIHGCLVTPECAAIAYIPATTTVRSVIGWNAGANSITELSGNMHTVFTMPSVAGAIVGLRSGRAFPTVPDIIEHGLYFNAIAGVDLVHVIERGVARTAVAARELTDTFEIRRVNGAVTYLKNNQPVYTSLAGSTGTKVVNACLYASGDSV